MNIIAVDDEQLALEQVQSVLEEVFANAPGETKISGFQKYREALAYVAQLKEDQETLEYAFLDIRMRGMRGIELAKEIKDVFPEVKILFVTGYSEYACEAFQLHALGYILKPATKENIEEVLDALNLGWRGEHKEEVRVQTFGNFDVYVNDKVVRFDRSKSKELLAYLVDLKGTGATTSEVSAILWEDRSYDRNLKNQTQKVISVMMKNLKEAGIENMVIKKWNYLAVDTSTFVCDYYDFLKEDGMAVNAYMGSYMNNYSWAEFTSAMLQERVISRND